MAKNDVATTDPMLSLFDSMAGEAEVLEEDMGAEVDWEVTPTFLGIYTGMHKTIPMEGQDDRPYDAQLFGFTEIPSGTKRCVWGPYQIAGAMENVNTGDAVLFQFKERRQNGGKQINIFDIRVKRIAK